MAERRVPRIRFKGFEEDWEQRKLGELAFITTGKLDANAAKKDGEYNFFTCGKEILKTNSYAFDGEAILINGNGDLGYTRKYVGKFNAYQRTYVLQGFVMDYEYIEHAIHKFLPDKIKNESIGGAMPYIKIDSLMNLELPIPVVQEAVAVTRFLNELDSLLSLHQRKLEKLKILKKAMLEKMFPKNGAKVPEIRFSGFTDDWEQRKLGELAFITTGKLDANAAKKDGEYNFFTCGKEILKTNSYAFDGEAILINGNGDLGYTRKYVGKFNAYQRTYVLQGFVMDYEYIEHAIHKFLPDKIKNESIGGAMPYIKIDSLMNLELPIPVVQEAVAVTRFLNELDSLLSLHQRKLEKLRQIKKSMLERMFV